ncbi:MAG: PRC-barrel domain-containing protein [Sandaracinaceae bacterium]|nr:PRC-barrel domain-containing protein [Sandaracinaceae bacterium]
MSEIRFSDLKGKGVLTQDGRICGEITDVVLDHGSWGVPAIVVKLERELLELFAMKKPMFGSQTIRVQTGHVSGVGDKVILHKSLADLSALYRDGSDSSVVAEEGGEGASE